MTFANIPSSYSSRRRTFKAALAESMQKLNFGNPRIDISKLALKLDPRWGA